MKKIKVGIIGCGKQAGKHVSSLQKMPGISIIAADINIEYAQNFALQKKCEYAKSPEILIDDATVDALVLCTPTPSHVPLIRQALEQRKHVFCEKPLSESLEEAESLQDALERAGTILMLGYIYRFVPVFEECYRLFQEDTLDGSSLSLGRPLTGYFRLGGRGSHQVWKHKKDMGGGAINEMLVHMIDLVNWFFGPIDDIDVISCGVLLPERTIDSQIVKADAEDYILVKCVTSAGQEFYCQADLITPEFCQYVEIQAENGTFRGSIQGESPSYVFLKEGRAGYDSGKTIFNFGQRNMIDIQMTSFIQCVRKEVQPDRNTLHDSLELMKSINKIKEQVA